MASLLHWTDKTNFDDEHEAETDALWVQETSSTKKNLLLKKISIPLRQIDEKNFNNECEAETDALWVQCYGDKESSKGSLEANVSTLKHEFPPLLHDIKLESPAMFLVPKQLESTWPGFASCHRSSQFKHQRRSLHI